MLGTGSSNSLPNRPRVGFAAEVTQMISVAGPAPANWFDRCPACGGNLAGDDKKKTCVRCGAIMILGGLGFKKAEVAPDPEPEVPPLPVLRPDRHFE